MDKGVELAADLKRAPAEEREVPVDEVVQGQALVLIGERDQRLPQIGAVAPVVRLAEGVDAETHRSCVCRLEDSGASSGGGSGSESSPDDPPGSSDELPV